MMLGSIPQQDVFQRVASSKDERTAGRASILGGCLYFCFAFIPMFLAYSATLIDPQLVQKLIDGDKQSQLILPNMILNHAPLFAQVMFFGALLSAIKSCASATLLAPSVTFTENILRPAFKHLGDKQLLRLMRIVVLCFTVLVTLFALNSQLSIYKMVENAYKVTLVSAFVPLAFGLYWKRANTQGALAAIVLGLATWIWLEILAPNAICPPQLAGFFAALFGMIAGSLAPLVIRHKRRRTRPRIRAIRRRAKLRSLRARCSMTAAGSASPWYRGMRIAVFALLACNTAYYLYAGTLAKGLDAAAWLVLLALFALETGFAAVRAHAARRLRHARREARSPRVGVCAAGIGYVIERTALDAVNTALWIAVVVLLEIEVRSPARGRALPCAVYRDRRGALCGARRAGADLGLARRMVRCVRRAVVARRVCHHRNGRACRRASRRGRLTRRGIFD